MQTEWSWVMVSIINEKSPPGLVGGTRVTKLPPLGR